MKSQVVLSIGDIFETVFISMLQDNTSQSSSVSLTTSLYQVRMIPVLLGTVNVEGKILA